jgi:dipeptidyl aminopeptidase/acylaminoacyl peptidase
MFRPRGTIFILVVVGLGVIAPLGRAQEAEPTAAEAKQAEREAMYYRYLEFPSYVKGGSVEPHWMADGSSFWYAEGGPEQTVIWKVDPQANTRTELFDTARLRQAVTPLLDHEPAYEGLPFEEFTFVDEGEKEVTFTVEDKEFILRLDTYQISRVPSVSEEERRRLVPQLIGTYSFSTYGVPTIDIMEILSPDGRWFASVRDYNLWLRSTDDDRAVQLTTDSIRDYGWGRYWDDWAWWSPNSQKLVVRRGDYRNVPKYPIVDYLKPRVEVHWSLSDSDPAPPSELFVVDILTKKLVRVATGTEPDQKFYVLGWRPDGSELLFLRLDRRTTKIDLMAANPSTGSTRIILTESRTTWGFWLQWERLFTPLEDGARFIWRSERDGWNHLYLYDLDGNLIRRLTEGLFPVVQVVAADEKAGWVYFTAHGDPQRPYDTHLYRVNLEGNRLARLTEATGQHDIQFAPSKEFFLDTHSNVDRPPAVELKRADGTLLQTVSKANIDALKELKWSPPEEFVVKAADGETDLYGVLYKPYDFDPKKKYPVIDRIYGSPARAFVPRTFIPEFGYVLSQARGQLGFIHLIVDARGTPERGREFQEVVYGNLGRNEIPDHVAALQQLAETRPYMDLSRVGIQGHSFGAYFAIRAMLLAPDVYHVGVAGAGGAHYNPEDNPELWNDILTGSKEAFDYASNLNLAANLKGKLFLLHGTSDVCVPFSGTMRMVDALIRAGKHFDLLVLPGVGHQFRGTSSSDRTSQTHAFEAIRRYFQEHLKP